MVLSQSQSRRAQSWRLPVSQPRGVALVTLSLLLVCSPKIQQARCLRVRMCLMEPRGAPNDLEMFNAAFVRTNYWDVLIPAQGLIYDWLSSRVQSYGPRPLPTSLLHAESLDMCPVRKGTTLKCFLQIVLWQIATESIHHVWWTKYLWHPKFVCWNPTLNVMVLDEPLEVIRVRWGREGRALVNGISALTSHKGDQV